MVCRCHLFPMVILPAKILKFMFHHDQQYVDIFHRNSWSRCLQDWPSQIVLGWFLGRDFLRPSKKYCSPEAGQRHSSPIGVALNSSQKCQELGAHVEPPQWHFEASPRCLPWKVKYLMALTKPRIGWFDINIEICYCLIYPYLSLVILIYPYLSLFILIYPCLFLCILTYPYLSLFILIYPYSSLLILIYSYFSLFILVSYNEHFGLSPNFWQRKTDCPIVHGSCLLARCPFAPMNSLTLKLAEEEQSPCSFERGYPPVSSNVAIEKSFLVECFCYVCFFLMVLMGQSPESHVYNIYRWSNTQKWMVVLIGNNKTNPPERWHQPAISGGFTMFQPEGSWVDLDPFMDLSDGNPGNPSIFFTAEKFVGMVGPKVD